MAKIDTAALMFSVEDVKSTTSLLPRLIRNVFFGLRITNEGYLARYLHDYLGKNPDRSRKEFSQKAAADRKVLMEQRRITFNMIETILSAMGYNIEVVQIQVRDRLMGETKTFSTDMSIEQLMDMINREQEVGIDSIA
jgi:uncharacterized protein YneF (UPF0154 family)